MIDVAVKVAVVAFVFFGVLNLAAVHTWLERKQSAIIQDRIGANRASIYGWRVMGLFHPLADTIKMFTKEDIVPAGADKILHTLAPAFSVFFALVAFAGIPFGDRLVLGDRVIEFQIAKIDAALLYIFAMLSLGVYGVILAGFASHNNYAMLGGLRATAQMVSYELAMGFSLVCVLMAAQSLNLGEIVRMQEGGWGLFNWFWIPLFPIFLVYIISGVAETNRAPFDVAEGESEIVAGFHVEYSGMAFAVFFLAEYANMILIATLASIMFLGGWLSPVPAVVSGAIGLPWLAADNFGWLLVKMFMVVSSFLWFRATFPRYRYDQIMRLGWKVFLPLTILYIVVLGAWMQTPLWIWWK